MKKILFMFIAILGVAFMSSCDKHKNSQPNLETNVVAKLDVEHVVAMDRQEMYLNHGDNYRWFETCMKLNDFLDEENDGSLEEVVNVFQVVTDYDGKSFDVKVYKFQHFADGTVVKDSVDGFWVEDEPLNEEAVTVTYEQAYEKLMATNCPKPHSKYCVLRKQVGAIDANPQYIFGNIREDVFVDAVTGEVLDENPAFPAGFKMPLGEWP